MALPLPQRTQSNTRAEHLSDHNTLHEFADEIYQNLKGFVNHGAVAGTARPSGFASIEWYGSVAPSNAINGDTWVDTSP